MTTLLELFRDALDETSAVGIDSQLTDDEQQTCLRDFNRFIGNLSTQSLAVYGLADQTFNTANGTATYTIGVGGTWNTTRPIRISDPAYSTINSVTFPCISITQDEYNLILYKAQPQQYPEVYLFVNDNPLASITLWPVPNAVTPITFSIERVLSVATSVYDTIIYPPGYEDMFESNMAVRLARRFGTVPSPELIAQAKSTLADIKRANLSQRKRVMRSGLEYSDAPVGGYGTPYDWMVQ